MITTGLGSTSAGLTVTAVKDGGNMFVIALCCFLILSASNNTFVPFFVAMAVVGV